MKTINDINIILGANINGASYVSDKFGNLIGWYDYDFKFLHIDERYKYVDKLIEYCIGCDFQIDFKNIEEPEVLKYFAQRRIRVRKYLQDKKDHQKWLDEQMKYIPSRKKVKNAAEKIRKRHG